MKKYIIDAIKEYIETCPCLANGKINVDYLSEKATEYAIEPIPIQTVLKEYLDGTKRRQFGFVFTSVNSYGQDVLQNLLNSRFYEDFSDWIEENNQNDILPDIEGIESIKCTSPGYAFQTSIDTARYQIQMKIIYEK